jgi:mannose-6-phosphate isomerase-like protein (cupin superfamily)
MTTFPGGTAVSRIRVYDWPSADGPPGGSPHLHTASTEGYLVLAGHGRLETLSGQGYREHRLAPDTVLWFTPGTVHRLVNTGGLEILVLMSNAGLPEAGDAVLTFPPEVLADPAAYRRAATLPDRPGPLGARRRRDLAVTGYVALREHVRADGPAALGDLYRAAAALVADRVPDWRTRWRDGPLARAVDTGDQLDQLAARDGTHLVESAVYTADPATARYGMCGHLSGWELAGR